MDHLRLLIIVLINSFKFLSVCSNNFIENKLLYLLDEIRRTFGERIIGCSFFNVCMIISEYPKIKKWDFKCSLNCIIVIWFTGEHYFRDTVKDNLIWYCFRRLISHLIYFVFNIAHVKGSNPWASASPLGYKIKFIMWKVPKPLSTCVIFLYKCYQLMLLKCW